MSSFRRCCNNKTFNNSQMPTVNKIIEYVYSHNFIEILHKTNSDFIDNIESQIISMIKANNLGNELNCKSDLFIYENQKPSLISKYESDYSLLNFHYEKFKSNPKEISYLTKYRKHCINSDATPIHKCSSKYNTFGKFIEVKDGNNINDIKYVICTECYFCYEISCIKVYCSECKCDYFSSKLANNENENILPATWKEYHCNPIIINEMMKCIKCQNILYLNLLSKKLVCLNKKCNFNSNPRSIIWKCKICKGDFRSLAKVYNPLEKQILEKEIWKVLLYKQLSFPKTKLCCLKNEKNENIKFFHDKLCKGELFKGNLKGNEIIVCNRCHAVNFYDKFIWTCPKCNKKITSNNKSQNNKKGDNSKINNNIKLKNELKLENANKPMKNINDLNKSKANETQKINKKHYYDNNLMLQYYFTQRKNNDNNSKRIYEAKQQIEKLKKNLTSTTYLNNSNLNYKEKTFFTEFKPNYFKKFKKIKYKTLFDILEEREKYQLDNQIIKENKTKKDKNDIDNNESIQLYKKKSYNKYSIKKTNMIKEYCANTSKNKHKNIIINKYLSPFHVSNNKNKLHSSKEKNVEIIKINLFKKSPNKTKRIESDLEEEINYSLNKDLIYSKRYKDEHSTTTNDDYYEKNELRKHTKSTNRNHKINLDNKKIYINEQDNTWEIKKSKTKILDKNIIEEKDNIENIKVINNNLDIIEQKKTQIIKNSNNNKENNFLMKRIYLDKIKAKEKERFYKSKDTIKEKILKEGSKNLDDIKSNI